MRHEIVTTGRPVRNEASDAAGLDIEAANLDWLIAGSLGLLEQALRRDRYGRAATVSSFGAESAVLLHLVARVRADTPVLFIDTRMMFQETLDYRAELIERLGLGDVRAVAPDAATVRRQDTFGRLHLKDPDACCDLRKVQPLEAALDGFDSWVTGRKRYQGSARSALMPVERAAGGRLKLNPLAFWEASHIEAYFERFDLPRHPLAKSGFTSIGCAHCTSRPLDPSDPRSGRWAGTAKTECGIHFENGRIVRGAA